MTITIEADVPRKEELAEAIRSCKDVEGNNCPYIHNELVYYIDCVHQTHKEEELIEDYQAHLLFDCNVGCLTFWEGGIDESGSGPGDSVSGHEINEVILLNVEEFVDNAQGNKDGDELAWDVIEAAANAVLTKPGLYERIVKRMAIAVGDILFE